MVIILKLYVYKLFKNKLVCMMYGIRRPTNVVCFKLLEEYNIYNQETINKSYLYFDFFKDRKQN